MNEENEKWTKYLTDEDLAFLKRFVLASGSLKDLAASYDISYPTVRLRLDRLIDKIKLLEGQEGRSEFERTLRAAYADGKLDMETFKKLLAVHEQELEEKSHENRNPVV